MIEVICITQKEGSDNLLDYGYPLCFFNSIEDARTEFKLIEEVARSLKDAKVFIAAKDRIVVTRYNQMFNEYVEYHIGIDSLRLADALNLMRLVRPAITPMHYLVSDSERPAL